MAYFVGIDIGGTNVEIGILNAEGDILGKESIKTESKKGLKILLIEFGIRQKSWQRD